MKKQFAWLPALCLLLTACGMDVTETDTAQHNAAPPAAASPADEVSEKDADAPPKTAEELGLPTSAQWNPEKQEWYDSDYYTWDEENHKYVYLDDAARTAKQKAEGRYKEPVVYETEEFTGEIPADFEAAMNTFSAALEAKFAEDPALSLRSDLVFDVCPEEYAAAEEYALRYFDTCAKLAVTENDYYVLAYAFVCDVLHPQIGFTANVGEMRALMDERYTAATEAVQAAGETLSVEKVAALQEQFGFMIAPALRDMGALDLLTVPADAPCTDPKKLATFADYFAP